jgi:hypothetical protein
MIRLLFPAALARGTRPDPREIGPALLRGGPVGGAARTLHLTIPPRTDEVIDPCEAMPAMPAA